MFAGRPRLFSVFRAGLRRVVRVPALFLCVVVTYLFGIVNVSFGGALLTLSDVVHGRIVPLPAALVVLWAVLWAFLWGGIISRYGGHPAVRARGFFPACAAHAGPLLRLTFMAAMAWLGLVGLLTPLAFDATGRIRRPQPPPGMPAAATSLLTPYIVVFVILFGAIYLSLQLARVRAVVEDRQSAVFSVLAGWRLLAARPVVVIGLALLTGALLLVQLWILLFLLALVPEDSAWFVRIESLLGGGYLVVSQWAELQIAASLVALYEAQTTRGALAGQVEAAPPLVSDMTASLAKE